MPWTNIKDIPAAPTQYSPLAAPYCTYCRVPCTVLYVYRDLPRGENGSVHFYEHAAIDLTDADAAGAQSRIHGIVHRPRDPAVS
jgi:hypothetical protein